MKLAPGFQLAINFNSIVWIISTEIKDACTPAPLILGGEKTVTQSASTEIESSKDDRVFVN